MGAAISNVGGSVGGAGAAKAAISDVGRSAAEGTARVGGALQQIVGNLNSLLTQGEKAGKAGAAAGGGAAKQALQSFQSDLTRLAYIAVLEKAMNKASGAGHFNVETAVNDLWVALDGVRKGHKATGMAAQAQMQQLTDQYQLMTNMIKQMHDMTMGAIRNIR